MGKGRWSRAKKAANVVLSAIFVFSLAMPVNAFAATDAGGGDNQAIDSQQVDFALTTGADQAAAPDEGAPDDDADSDLAVPADKDAGLSLAAQAAEGLGIALTVQAGPDPSGEDGHYSGGSGTAEDPWQISKPEDLVYMAEQNRGFSNDLPRYNFEGEYFILTNDIDLSTVCGEVDGSPTNDVSWTPIGTEYSWFAGYFDGQGHTISNMYINSSSQNAGLFGVVGSTTVFPAVVENLIVSGEFRQKGGSYHGGIAGYVRCTYSPGNVRVMTIRNCASYVDVKGGSNVGGIVGAAQYAEKLNIEGCVNYGNVSGSSYTGGIIGDLRNYDNVPFVCNIKNCANYGDITGSSPTGGIAGGITANNNAACMLTVDGCFNTGTVKFTNGNAGQAICGQGAAGARIAYTNDFFLEGGVDSVAYGTAVDEATMKSALFVKQLGGSSFGHTPGSYPTPVWQGISGAPTITTQPVAIDYVKGSDAAALTVAAEKPQPVEGFDIAGTDGELSYQWYAAESDDFVAGKPIEGATKASYTPSVAEAGTAYYYCLVTNTWGEDDIQSQVYSDIVRIYVADAIATFPAVTVSEGATYDYNGQVKPLKVTITNIDDMDAVSYQWYQNDTASNTGGTAILGEVNDTFTPSTLTPGSAYYYCVVSNTFQGQSVAATATDPVEIVTRDSFTISTADDLELLATAVNAGISYNGVTVKLANDIDLSSKCSAELGISWTPIGVYADPGARPFSGVFDGQYHTISGLYINSTERYQGLFGYAGNNAKVKNLIVEGSVTASNWTAGGIVAYAYGSGVVLENLHNRVDVTAQSGGGVVGGLSGRSAGEYATIRNCSNEGNITFQGSWGGGLAGVAGSAERCLCENLYNTGTITVTEGSPSNVAGVVGQVSNTSTNIYRNFYNAGLVNCNMSNANGPIIGFGTDSVTCSNMYYLKGTFDINKVYRPEWLEGEATLPMPTTEVTAEWLASQDAIDALGDAFVYGGTSPKFLWELGASGLPLFITHPQAAEADLNAESPTLVALAGAVPGFEGYGNLAYQWYRNEVNSIVGGEAIEGATSGTYKVPTNVGSSYYYYCVVTNTAREGASLASMPAPCPVYSGDEVAAPVFETQPTSVEYGFGAAPEALKVKATVTGAGAGVLSYQWYQSDDAVADPENDLMIDGAAGTEYTPSVDSTGTKYYYCVATNTFEILKTKSTTSEVAEVTVSTDYIVRTADDMYKLSEMSLENGAKFDGVNVIVANDIDMQEGVKEGDDPKEWNGIETFNGNFNGGGHRISNLYSSDYYGLFYEVAAPVTIENFVLDGEVTADFNVGGVACHVNSRNFAEGEHVTFRNIGNEMLVTAKNYYGGIVDSAGGAVIENCYNAYDISSASFNGSGSFYGYLCGISRDGASVIRNCYNTGNIHHEFRANQNWLYGICQNADVIENCYATSSFSATNTNYTYCGTISSNVDVPKNCYYLDTTNAGVKGGTAKTEEEMKAAAFASELGDAFVAQADSYPVLKWQVSPGAPTINTQPEGAVYFMPVTNVTPLVVVASLPVKDAIGGNGALSYKWYKSDKADMSGSALIENADAASYTPVVGDEGTTYYQCFVTNTYTIDGVEVTVTTETDVVAVVVIEKAKTPVIDDSALKAVTYGTSDTPDDLAITAKFAEGDEGFEGEITYQWFMSETDSAEGGVAIEGATDASIKPDMTKDGTTYYYAQAYNTYGGLALATSTSKTVAVTVNPDMVIKTPADLRTFVDSLATKSYEGGIIVVDNDIDLSTDEATKNWDMPQLAAIGNINGGVSGWSADGGYVFKGTFDGRGHTISGLNINTDKAIVGLIPGAYNAKIKNVTVIGDVTSTAPSNASFNISGNRSATAALLVGCGAGWDQNGDNRLKIENVTVAGSVTAKSYAAGIVGIHTGGMVTLANCVNYATITSGSSASGLAATGVYASWGNDNGRTYNVDPTIRFEGCANHGDICMTAGAGNLNGLNSYGSGMRYIDCYNDGNFYIDETCNGTIRVAGFSTGGSTNGNGAYQFTNCFDCGKLFDSGTGNRTTYALSYKANITPDYSKNVFVLEDCLELSMVGSGARGEYVTAETMASDEFVATLGDSFKKGAAHPLLAFETGIGTPTITDQTTGEFEYTEGDVADELSVTADLPIAGLVGHEGELSYQWYYQGSDGKAVAFGENSNTAVPPTNIPTDYYKVYCKVTNTFDGGKTATAKSQNVKMHIITTLDASEPYLTQQPTSTWYQLATNSNTKADPALKVSVYQPADDPTVGEISYQWYAAKTIQDYRNATGRKIAGATNDTYQPYIQAVGTVYYYCIVTNTIEGGTQANKIATAKSNVVKVRTWSIDAAKPVITTQPVGDVLYQQGDAPEALVVKASTPTTPDDVVGGAQDEKDGLAALSYQWYYNTTGTADPENDTKVTGATTDTWTPGTNIDPGIYYYYCVIDNTFKTSYPASTQTATSVSDLAKVTIVSELEAAEPVITESTLADATYVNGDQAEPMSVTASFENPDAPDAGELTYQWYASTDPVCDPEGDSAIPGATAAELNLNTAMKPGVYKVYCAVTNTIENGARADKFKTVCSDPATITIKAHEIYTSADIVALRNSSSNGFQGHYVYLMNDIDVSDICGPDKGNWQPISSWFYGVFDGNNHRITGVYFNGSQTQYGFFGSIQNATLRNFVVEGTIIDSSCQYVGGIVGYASGKNTIENVGNEIEVQACVGTYQYRHSVAGIVGYVDGNTAQDNSLLIKNCYNKAPITNCIPQNTSANYLGTGGIVGHVNNCVTIEDCYNTGDITGGFAGGIAGTHQNANSMFITNVYNAGTITSTYEAQPEVGGIIGGPYNGSERIVNAVYLEGSAPQGGIGYEDGTASGVTSATADAMKADAFAMTMGGAFKEGNIYPALSWETEFGMPTITTQPVGGGYAEQGKKPDALSVEAITPVGDKAGANGTITYQWFKMVSDGDDIAVTEDGEEEGVFEPSTETLGTAYYYCVATNNYPGGTIKKSVKSSVVDFTTISATEPAVPEFTTQPVNAEYKQGDEAAALTVEAKMAELGAGDLAYQWFVSDFDSTVEGVAIEGATEASYIPPTDKAGTKYYYCVATNTFETYKSEDTASGIACVTVSGYQISTAEELLAVSKSVAAGNTLEGIDIELVADIDLSSVCGEEKGSWLPIGSASSPFMGSIEGNGHRVSNLYIDSTADNQGLIGYMKGGEVRDLIVTGSVKGANNVAGVAGYGLGASFYNIRNEATVEATGNYIGGVAGYTTNDVNTFTMHFDGCANTADISGNQYVGGITGFATYGGWRADYDSCRNTGTIKGASGNVGGITGGMNSGSMTNCYNTGATFANNGDSGSGYALSATFSYQEGRVLQGFYLEGTGNVLSGANYFNMLEKTDETMKAEEFVEELGGAFKAGNTYPVLKWEEDAGMPVIVSQPSSVSLMAGADPVAMTVVAEAPEGGSADNLSYQWFADGEAVAGATNASYAPAATDEVGSTEFFCAVTYTDGDAKATINSETVTYAVTTLTEAAAPTILVQPIGGTYDVGEAATMSVEATVSGAGAGELSYQWYCNSTGVVDPAADAIVVGANDATYAPSTAKFLSLYYYCLVTNTLEGSKTASTASDCVLVNVNPDVQIKTAEDLATFRDAVNAGDTYQGKVVALMNDIDMSSVCPEGSMWLGIGQPEKQAFLGTFDGQGHTIYNFSSTQKSYDQNTSCALFGYLRGGATVQNFILKGNVISRSYYNSPVVSYARGYDDNWNTVPITLRNIGNEANFEFPDGVGQYTYTGGIIANGSNVNIDSCYSKGEMHSFLSMRFGSIAGSNSGGYVKNCYANGVFGTNSGYYYDGFIIGDPSSCSIDNCYAVGTKSTRTGNYALTGLYGTNFWGTPDGGNNWLPSSLASNSSSIVTFTDEEHMRSAEFAAELGSAYKYNEGGYPMLQWEYLAPTNLADAGFAISEIPAVTYDGAAAEPEFTVSDGETVLTAGTDYTFEYANNNALGTATLTVTGAGVYAGTLIASFTIKPADINDVATVAGVENGRIADIPVSGDGTAVRPSITVKDTEGNELVENVDFKVEFVDAAGKVVDEIVEAGEYTAVISGIGGFYGTLGSYKFSVVARAAAVDEAEAALAAVDLEKAAAGDAEALAAAKDALAKCEVLTAEQRATMTPAALADLVAVGLASAAGDEAVAKKAAEDAAKAACAAAGIAYDLTLSPAENTAKATEATEAAAKAACEAAGIAYDAAKTPAENLAAASEAVAAKAAADATEADAKAACEAAGIAYDAAKTPAENAAAASEAVAAKAAADATEAAAKAACEAAGIAYDATKTPAENAAAASKAASEKAAADAEAARVDVSKAGAVEIAVAKATYTGKKLEPAVAVKAGGKELAPGTDYDLVYANNTKAGTGVVIVAGKGAYKGATYSTFTISKGKNAFKIKAKAGTAKKALKVKAGKSFKSTKYVKVGKRRFGGKVSFKLASVSKKAAKKYIAVNAKSGKVAVKKGLKAGTYTLKVKVTSKATSNYKAVGRTVKVVIKVS